MSITKSFINKFLSLMLVLSVVLAGLLPSTAVYASEVNTPGSAKSNAVLNSDGLIMDVTVPTNVLIYVDEHGEVTTPDYLPIINNSAAPVFVHSLTVTPQNGWTLDPTNTDYTNFKVNQKNYWLSFNGLDPSNGPIALATPINGSDSLNLVLSADVAPQRTAISGLNIGEIVITLDWDMNPDAEEGDQEQEFSIEGATFLAPRTYIVIFNAPEAGMYFVAATLPDDPAPEDPYSADIMQFVNVSTAGTQEQTVLFDAASEEMKDADIYIWRMTGEGDFVGPLKTTVREEVNQDINFEVHSVDHGGEGIVEFCMTVEAPCTVGFEMVPAGSQPPQNGTSSFNLDYAGTQTRGVEIYGGYDDSIDYDIYIWVYDAEWNPVGPVVAHLPAKASEGDQGFGFSVEGVTYAPTNILTFTLNTTESGNYYVALVPPDSTPPLYPEEAPLYGQTYVYVYEVGSPQERTIDFYPGEYMGDADMYVWRSDPVGVLIGPIKVKVTEEGWGEYVHEGVIPDGYELATDADFSGRRNGEFKYIGTKPNVVIPHVIKGIPVTSYKHMFDENSIIRGVCSDNKNINSMHGMFTAVDVDTLDLSFLDTSTVYNMTQMFTRAKIGSLNLTGFDTSNVNLMTNMFTMAEIPTVDLSGFDTSNVTYMNEMFNYAEIDTLDISSFDTSKVIAMNFMFANADINNIISSDFDLSSVDTMSGMFQSSHMNTVDISSFNLAEIQPDVSAMFAYAQATTVYVRSQADIDYIIANHGYWDIPETLNFVIK